MAVFSKVYSFVQNFILSMILPTTEKSVSSIFTARFWAGVWETVCNFFYSICKWLLAFMDFLQYFIQKLIGLDYWLERSNNGRRTLAEATSEDMIFKFLYADSVQKVFRAAVAIFVVLLIIFTIYAIIKSEWDYITGGGEKSNSKASIFRSSMKAIALVIVFPLLLVMGIVSSNAILASLINAVGVDMSETFGGKIFSISAMDANKYKHYVDANTYYPTSDKVVFYLDDNHKQIKYGAGSDDNFHVYYSNYNEYLYYTAKGTKYEINSIYEPLVPKNQKNFSGFCFRIDDIDGNYKYYFISANSSNNDCVYYYLTRVLGAKVLNEDNMDESKNCLVSDEDGLDLIDAIKSSFKGNENNGCYISNFNIKKGTDLVRETARNSWNYSLIYTVPGISLSQNVTSCGEQFLSSYGLATPSSTEKGAILYNSSSIDAYFDGGQFGVVQSRSEYGVMSDVVNFMCDNGLTFYIMDATSTLINWKGNTSGENRYYVDSGWISNTISSSDGNFTNLNDNGTIKTSNVATTLPYNFYDREGTRITVESEIQKSYLTFLTSYSNNNTLACEREMDVIYTAKFDVGDESQGSRYIICLKDGGLYYPLVNGKTLQLDGKSYTFKSDYYSSDYKGVVWAKGTFDTSTVQGRYGLPTYLKNTVASEISNGSLLSKIGDFVSDAVTSSASDKAYFYMYGQVTNATGGTNDALKLYPSGTRILNDGNIYGYNGGNIYNDTLSLTKVTGTDAANLTLPLSYSSYVKFEGSGNTYTFTYTGFRDASGKCLYSSENSGICYVIYVDLSGNIYQADFGDDGKPKVGSQTNSVSAKACYRSPSGVRRIKNFVLDTIDLGGADSRLGADAAKEAKGTFSVFKGADDDSYVGTFTKTALVAVDKTEIASKTKKFTDASGNVYYNIQTEGRVKDLTELKELAAVVGATDSVSCLRYNIEDYKNNTFSHYLLEINTELFKSIFEIKFGSVAQVSSTPKVSSTFIFDGEKQGITFDYFFDQNIELQTFYSAGAINYLILLVSTVLIIKVLFNSLWGVIKRFYMITLYYLAMPVAASTMPIDNGRRFGDVQKKIIGEVLSTYGVLIGLNLFFVILQPIRDITSTIFTEEVIANSGSYFLQKLPISAAMLNELVYILFLLVAFTLINELPGFVQGLVGYGTDLNTSGSKTFSNVKQTMKESGDMISGKTLKEGVVNTVKAVPGVIPGSQFMSDLVSFGKNGIGALTKKFEEGKKEAEGGGSDGGGGGDNGGGNPPKGNNREDEDIGSESKPAPKENSRESNPMDEEPVDKADAKQDASAEAEQVRQETEKAAEEIENKSHDVAENIKKGSEKAGEGAEKIAGNIGNALAEIPYVGSVLKTAADVTGTVANKAITTGGEIVSKATEIGGKVVAKGVEETGKVTAEVMEKAGGDNVGNDDNAPKENDRDDGDDKENQKNKELQEQVNKDFENAQTDKQNAEKNAEDIDKKLKNATSDGELDKIQEEIASTDSGKKAFKDYDKYIKNAEKGGRPIDESVRKEALKEMSDKSIEYAKAKLDKAEKAKTAVDNATGAKFSDRIKDTAGAQRQAIKALPGVLKGKLVAAKGKFDNTKLGKKFNEFESAAKDKANIVKDKVGAAKNWAGQKAFVAKAKLENNVLFRGALAAGYNARKGAKALGQKAAAGASWVKNTSKKFVKSNVVQGLLGKRKDSVGGALLGLAGKAMKATALAALVVANPLAGAAVIGGGFLAKKAIAAGKKFKAMSPKDKAKLITKWGGNALKVAGVAAIGLATGGAGLALAGGALTAGVLVHKNRKNKKYTPANAKVAAMVNPQVQNMTSQAGATTTGQAAGQVADAMENADAVDTQTVDEQDAVDTQTVDEQDASVINTNTAKKVKPAKEAHQAARDAKNKALQDQVNADFENAQTEQAEAQTKHDEIEKALKGAGDQGSLDELEKQFDAKTLNKAIKKGKYDPQASVTDRARALGAINDANLESVNKKLKKAEKAKNAVDKAMGAKFSDRIKDTAGAQRQATKALPGVLKGKLVAAKGKFENSKVGKKFHEFTGGVKEKAGKVKGLTVNVAKGAFRVGKKGAKFVATPFVYAGKGTAWLAKGAFNLGKKGVSAVSEKAGKVKKWAGQKAFIAKAKLENNVLFRGALAVGYNVGQGAKAIAQKAALGASWVKNTSKKFVKSNAVQGLLGKRQDTVGGAVLGLAGKTMKATALAALVVANPLAGAAAIGGGFLTKKGAQGVNKLKSMKPERRQEIARKFGKAALAATGVGYLAMKGYEAGMKFRGASSQERAAFVTKWGGNALKVAGVAAIGLATGGAGLALAGGALTGGVLLAKNKKQKVRRSGMQTYSSAGQASGGEYSGAYVPAEQTGSVTENHSAAQTINIYVNDGSEAAKVIQGAIDNGYVLEGVNKQKAARYLVNTEAVSDKKFVNNKEEAYKNVVINSIGTKGGRRIAGQTLSSYINSTGAGIEATVLNGYDAVDENGNIQHVDGLLDAKSKIALYKSMMTSEQLANVDQKVAEGLNDSELIKFIERDIAHDGLGRKLGVSYNNEQGIVFDVNGNAIRGKGRQYNAVNAALGVMMQGMSSTAVANAVAQTGYTQNVDRAIAGNYALTLNYNGETTGNTSGDASEQAHHQQVFDKAMGNEQIVAEAILAYLEKHPDLFEQFKTDYRINDDTQQDQILESIIASKNNKETMIGKLGVEAYSQELSEATAKHVADGSLKVEAFDLLSKDEQQTYAGQAVANIAAHGAGKEYGLTEEQQETAKQMSEEAIEKDPAAFVRSAMGNLGENKGAIVNSLVAKHYGFDGSDGIDIGSKGAQNLLTEIEGNAELSRARADLTKKANYTDEDVVGTYAKAKLVGSATAETLRDNIGTEKLDDQAVEALLGEKKSGEKKSEEFKTGVEIREIKTDLPDLGSETVVRESIKETDDKAGLVDDMAVDALGIKFSSETGKIDTDSDSYDTMLDEIITHKNGGWYDKLNSFTDSKSEGAQHVITMFAKAKLLGEENDDVEKFLGEGANAREIDKRVVDRFANQDLLKSAYRGYNKYDDKDVQEYAAQRDAKLDEKALIERARKAFGYTEGGDENLNKEAENAAKDYIGSRGKKVALGVTDREELDKIRDENFKFAGLPDDEIMRMNNLVKLQQRGLTKEYIEGHLNIEGVDFEGTINKLRSAHLMPGDVITPEKITEENADNEQAKETAENLKQLLSSDQIRTVVRNGAENGFTALSPAGQNAVLVRQARRDDGAREVLVSNNVDMNSSMEISQFLNSSAGTALKERLIAEITASLFELLAQIKGVEPSKTYEMIADKTSKKQEAELYEKTQGELISGERVKQKLSENAESDNAEKIVDYAAGKMSLLTKEEHGEISQKGAYDYLEKNSKEEVETAKTEISKTTDMSKLSEEAQRAKVVEQVAKTNADAYRNAMFIGGLDAVNLARRAALSNGGLERQRAVANVIWDNTDLRSKAETAYERDHQGAKLGIVPEVDRNNYLFENYAKFASSESDAGKRISEIFDKSQIDFTQSDNSSAIKNLNQQEFNNLIHDMESDGKKIESETKQEIVGDLNKDGKLTEMPDTSKMDKNELIEYNSLKSTLQQLNNRGSNPELFANLYRNVTLVNDNDSVRTILSGGNTGISADELEKAKLDVLRNNKDFYAGAVLKVMALKENLSTYQKIIDGLKAKNVDYEKLSNAEQAEAVQQMLGDSDFVKKNKISNVNKLNSAFESEFAARAKIATNEQIKMGMTTEQINNYLKSSEGNPTRDTLIGVGAGRPERMFKKEKYLPARRELVFNDPTMRKMFVYTVLNEIRTDKQLREIIRKEIVRPDSPMFMSKMQGMTNKQINSYINSHLDELKYKLGVNMLFNKQNGRYIANNTIPTAAQDRTINKLETEHKTFLGKILGKVTKVFTADTEARSKDAELDRLCKTLLDRVEHSSKLSKSMDELVKKSLNRQVEGFFEGENVRALVRTRVERTLSDDPALADRIFNKHNAAVNSRIKALELKLAAIRNDYRKTS